MPLSNITITVNTGLDYRVNDYSELINLLNNDDNTAFLGTFSQDGLGGMTAYELNMTFCELDPVLANDYDGVDSTSDGMGF